MIWLNCKEACIAQCYTQLHLAALRHGPCLTPTRFIPTRDEPHLVIYIRNLQQQSPNVYQLLHISPTHERMIASVRLESATGSWTWAVGVRGECVTTQPPAPLKKLLTLLQSTHSKIDWTSTGGEIWALEEMFFSAHHHIIPSLPPSLSLSPLHIIKICQAYIILAAGAELRSTPATLSPAATDTNDHTQQHKVLMPWKFCG